MPCFKYFSALDCEYSDCIWSNSNKAKPNNNKNNLKGGLFRLFHVIIIHSVRASESSKCAQGRSKWRKLPTANRKDKLTTGPTLSGVWVVGESSRKGNYRYLVHSMPYGHSNCRSCVHNEFRQVTWEEILNHYLHTEAYLHHSVHNMFTWAEGHRNSILH